MIMKSQEIADVAMSLLFKVSPSDGSKLFIHRTERHVYWDQPGPNNCFEPATMEQASLYYEQQAQKDLDRYGKVYLYASVEDTLVALEKVPEVERSQQVIDCYPPHGWVQDCFVAEDY